MDKALPAAEQAKVEANYLRGTLAEELQSTDPAFSKPATAVLKFHGIYQQDDRDLRKSGQKSITAMVRVGVPGGVLTPEQYLTLDRLADYADGSLRITTRQDIQYHYVSKLNIRELIAGVNESYLSTLAACGDVVRNVVACPAPFEDEQRHELFPVIEFISRSLKPKTNAYYDVWVGGENVESRAVDQDEVVEPLYGATYLPRKFKIGFCFPGDNTIDVYSNDVGIIPHYDNGALTGYTILAGGGMGQSAGIKASHPRMADPICSVGPSSEELLEVVSAIVTIHRDFGNRSNRKLARLKYVLDEWGVDKFKNEIDDRVGRELAPPRSLTWTRAADYLGWHRQGVDSDGNPLWFVGIRVLSGRIRDFDAKSRLRTGLRTIVERFRTGVRLTCQQNLYLSGIREPDRTAVETVLQEYGAIDPETLPPILRQAMACPALPTCGLAITEAERIMPELVSAIQSELDSAGLGHQPIDLRVTGCPNGCARPYTAEIGIVGASVEMYTLYLGASPLSTRMGSVFAQNVKKRDIPGRLRPVFDHFKTGRIPGESFGDFCNRVGIAALRELTALTAA